MGELTKQEEQEYELQYYVVKSIEEQYSIWPTYKPIPAGWEAVGEGRKKADCLAYIDEVWTDMRPLSLRKQMEELEREEKENNKKKEIIEGEYKEEKSKTKAKRNKKDN